MSHLHSTEPEPRLLDFQPPTADMRSDVLHGLSLPQKQLLPKYFYDARGSELFDRITQLPEYYLTRTEDSIMRAHLPEMAERIGPRAAVIEFGSGSGEKISRLLRHLDQPVACVPVEISCDHLLKSARQLASTHPEIEVIAVCADFTQPFDLPPIHGARRKLLFFPGSTIGNFPADEAVQLLRVMRGVAGDNGALLIGVDLIKDPAVLETAYNDKAGVTAAFNLNLLTHINRELSTNFDLQGFDHQAVYNRAQQRIEMYLISLHHQIVDVAGQRFEFKKDERLLTEFAHKHSMESFAALAKEAGFKVKHVWTDARQRFSVQYLESV